MKPGKFDELKCILKAITHTVHLIILTETWIRSDSDANRLQLPNYTHVYNLRSGSTGGGVSIYVHNTMQFNRIEDNYTHGSNFLWIHIKKLSLNIGAIYRPPDANIKDFIDIYSSQIERTQRAIIFGDFNINLLGKDNLKEKYTDMICEEGYSIINKIDSEYCTRETATTKSIVDHIHTNVTTNTYHLAIIESSMSDHKQMYLEVHKMPRISYRKQKTNYQAIDYNKLQITASNEIEHIEGCNFQHLEEFIKSKICSSQITKTKILNAPNKDWINKDIVGEINKRNILWKKLKSNPNNQELKDIFIKKRNKVTQMIKSAKRQYYHKAFDNCNNKPKKNVEFNK